MQDKAVLTVTIKQLNELADFCITRGISPGAAILAILLYQIGNDAEEEQSLTRTKEWAHRVIDSIDSAMLESDYIH